MIRMIITAFTACVTLFAIAFAQPVPDRSLGEGPYDRLVICGATLIDGAGALHRPIPSVGFDLPETVNSN